MGYNRSIAETVGLTRIFDHDSLNFLPTLNNFLRDSRNNLINRVNHNDGDQKIKIIWVCGGTIGLVCIGLTLIAVIRSPKPTRNLKELITITDSGTNIVRNIFMFLESLKNKFKAT